MIKCIKKIKQNNRSLTFFAFRLPLFKTYEYVFKTYILQKTVVIHYYIRQNRGIILQSKHPYVPLHRN